GREASAVEHGRVERLMGARRAEKDRARLIAPHLVGLDQPVDVETLRLDFIDSMRAEADRGNPVRVDGPGEDEVEAQPSQKAQGQRTEISRINHVRIDSRETD